MNIRPVARALSSVLLFTVAVSLPTPAAAQSASAGPAAQTAAPAIVVPPPDVVQELVLRDGTTAFGRVERIDGPRVVFKTVSGAVLELDAGQVVSLKPVEGRVVKGHYFPADPNPTRLFFGPTARSLPAGSGYVGVYEFVLPFVQVGITDWLSIGGGTPLFFGEDTAHPFWFTPKVRVYNSKTTQAAVGLMQFLNVDGENIGVGYGVVTGGSTDSAISVGIGYAWEHGGDDGDGTSAVAMIGGEHRVSRRVKLITENYIFKDAGIASFGVRFLGDRLSADLALAMPIATDDFIVFPIVNFVWRFGKQ